MAENEEEVVIPVIREEAHADTIRVVTGGVRVTKQVESHDEVIEQELRKSSVDVQRIKMDQVVDGPQPVRREGNTLIVPVVSEVLNEQKQSVVTEEIHITEHQQQQTAQTKVTLKSERPKIERLDAAGNVISSNVESITAPAGKVVGHQEPLPDDTMKLSGQPARILRVNRQSGASLPVTPSILTNRQSKKTE